MKVTISSGRYARTLECAPGILLSEAIRSAGIPFPMPCGGNHLCGKCRVTATGALSPPGQAELDLSGGEGNRLACFARALGDCEVHLPNIQASVLRNGGLPQGEYDDFLPGSLGLAADIGTTTVAVYLYDLHTKTLLAARGEQNRQCAYGADVIARIDHSNIHGTAELQKLMLDQLNQLFAACLKAGAGKVRRITVTGNTTMLHFLTGKNPRGIAQAPFEAESYFGYEMDAGTLFPVFSSIPLYLPACVKSYVGGDITCAMMATRLSDRENALLLDVGTNGEMALYSDGKVLCCAAAAGPAFEGAGLSMGMTAAPGAVNKASFQAGRVCLETVGDLPPKGFCGTGIISILSLMRRTGVLDETGRIVAEGPLASFVAQEDQPVFRLENGLSVTQADVRAVQLAKAAIAAGLRTLLYEAGIGEQDVSVLYLCGGFGSYIDSREAAEIGLIPPALANRAVSAGNAAGTGASMLLLSSAMREESESLVRKAREISLSESAYFMEQYIDCMLFQAPLGAHQ